MLSPVVDLRMRYVVPALALPVAKTAFTKIAFNLHVGVRSDTLSTQRGDYLRNHLTTVISVRSLAFKDRYK